MTRRPAPAIRVTDLAADASSHTVELAEADRRVSRLAGGRLRVAAADGTPAVALIGPDHALTARDGRTVEVVVDGWRFELQVEPERRAILRERARRDRGGSTAGGPAEIRAIIPGRVVVVGVAAGDQVVAGERLLVLEAMKMQNELRAPRGGRVARVAVAEGRTVEAGDVLLVLE